MTRIYRCFHDGELQAGATIAIDRDEAHHLATVRRAGDGATVRVLNGRGVEAEGVLSAKNAVAVDRILRSEPRPAPPLELALALTRTDAFEDAIERAIELGATAFRAIESDHCVVRLDAKKAAARVERWQRMATERLKQCERLWLPDIHGPASLAEAVAAAKGPGVVPVLLAERAVAPPLADIVRQSPDRGLCLLVGPEGGWSAEERDAALAAGAVAASMGAAILRSETAALAGLATVLALRPQGSGQ